jgi:hypothetical protein
MRKIVLILLLITYITASSPKNYGKEFEITQDYDMLRPFIGFDLNMGSFNKISIDNKFPGISFGWLFEDDSRYVLSYYYGDEGYHLLNKKVQGLNLQFEHSLNNYGLQRGFYFGFGFNHNNHNDITYTYNDINNTYDPSSVKTSTNSFGVNIGFEYKINKNYLIDISQHADLFQLGSQKNYKQLHYTKASVKYLFGKELK